MVSTAHVTPEGKVALIDMGGEGEEPKVVDMAATDAAHALAADPDRYRLPTAFAPPPATVEQRLASLERRVEELDGWDKKRMEAIAADHKRIISEQVTPAEKPAADPTDAEKKIAEDRKRLADDQKRLADDEAVAPAPAAPVFGPAATPAPNPNWPAAPPAEQK